MTRGAWIGLGLLLAGFVRETTPDGTPLEWKRKCPLLEIGALAPSGPSAGELHDVVDGAIAAWQSDGCNALPFTVTAAADPGADVGLDGRNVIVTRAADYCDDDAHADEELCLSPELLAVTTTFHVDKPGDPRHGELIEVDLEINLRYAFGTGANAYDLRSVVAHELGHMLGLEHSCTTERGTTLVDPAGHVVPSCDGVLDDSVLASTMFPYGRPGETHQRSPESDERQAMCLVYRDHAETCEATEYNAGCACSSTPGSAFLVALGVLTMLFARRR